MHPRFLNLLALLLVACGAPSEATNLEDVGRSAHAIVNGEPSPASDDSVMSLIGGDGGARSWCTATLVAPDIVVTALHCVAEFAAGGEFLCTSDGTLASPPPDGVLGQSVPPGSIELRAGAGAGSKEVPDALGRKVFRSGATDICKQDIAVVVLDRELDVPITAMRLRSRTERGERMRVVGYGVNGTDMIERYARGDVRVTDVGEDREQAAAGKAPPYTFVLTEGACQGDSGGPAISEETAAITGVYSISAGADCTATGVRNIYTALMPFEKLIMDAFEYAGRTPVLEPGSNTADAGEPVETEATDPPKPGGGSGSRRESTCAFGAARTSDGSALLASALVALAVFRRRARR